MIFFAELGYNMRQHTKSPISPHIFADVPVSVDIHEGSTKQS